MRLFVEFDSTLGLTCTYMLNIYITFCCQSSRSSYSIVLVVLQKSANLANRIIFLTPQKENQLMHSFALKFSLAQMHLTKFAKLYHNY